MSFVCVGDLMLDVVATLPGPLAAGSDTPAPIAVFGGGSAANTACWLVAAGAAAAFVGRAGGDVLGDTAVAGLLAAGVRTEVRRVSAASTGTCIVLVAPDGERTMVPDAGANSTLHPDDVPTELLAAGNHLHLSGYALLNPSARAAALAVLDRARRAGCSISVDAASAAPLAGVGAEAFLGWVGGGVLVLANLDEARVLTGRVDPEAAATALAGRCGQAVVKLGADGAIWAGPEGTARVPAEAVTVLDTTGAGDAFAAGFLAATAAGCSPAEGLRRAHQLAARAVTTLGGRPTFRSAPAE